MRRPRTKDAASGPRAALTAFFQQCLLPRQSPARRGLSGGEPDAGRMPGASTVGGRHPAIMRGRPATRVQTVHLKGYVEKRWDRLTHIDDGHASPG